MSDSKNYFEEEKEKIISRLLNSHKQETEKTSHLFEELEAPELELKEEANLSEEEVKEKSTEDVKEKSEFEYDIKSYIKRGALLTKREAMVYKLLLPYEKSHRLRILYKVRLYDIVDVKDDAKDRQSHINKINQRHVDFLLCSTINYSPIAVIEVDDINHYSKEGQEKDIFKNNLFAQTKIKLARIRQRDERCIQEELRLLFDTICPECCGDLYVQTNSKTLDKFWGCENWIDKDISCEYKKSIKNKQKESELFI